MDVEFFVHGVPKGESFWGKNEEKAFLSQFYDGKTDVEKMYVYSRSFNGINYVYYTFLISNTIDVNGRSGGYFGMTLRLDAYCLDYVAMYQILSLVYRNHVVGSILQKLKGKIQYNIGDFGNSTEILKDIREKLFSLIQAGFGRNSFLQIPKVMAGSGKSTLAINLYDYSQEDVMGFVSSYSRIALSPYYTSKQVAELKNGYDKQVDSVQKQYSQQILQEREYASKDKKSLSNKLQEVTSSMSALQSELSAKDNTINSLRNQVKQIEATVRQQGKLRKIENVVAEVREPLVKLADLIGEIVPSSNEKTGKLGRGEQNQMPPLPGKNKESKFSFSSFFHKALTPVFLFIILGVVCVLGYQMKAKLGVVVEQVNNLQQQNAKVVSSQRAVFQMMRQKEKSSENTKSSRGNGFSDNNTKDNSGNR